MIQKQNENEKLKFNIKILFLCLLCFLFACCLENSKNVYFSEKKIELPCLCNECVQNNNKKEKQTNKNS